MQKVLADSCGLISSGLATMTEMRNILLKQKRHREELLKKITEAKASCVTANCIDDLESSTFKDLMKQIVTE